MNPILELREVSRVHGSGPTAVTALSGVNLRLDIGELVAIMGPSGSGKSTLLMLCGGLDSPTSGEVAVDGTVLGSLNRRRVAQLRRRSIGYIFQQLNLIPSLTALENVMLPRELDGTPTRAARSQSATALCEVGLEGFEDRFPEEMSGGEQQRVAIARALVGSRRLVLADEPTGALDSHTGEDILRILRARCDAGAAALLVTHDARHAGWADRVIFLSDGAPVGQSGPLANTETLREVLG